MICKQCFTQHTDRTSGFCNYCSGMEYRITITRYKIFNNLYDFHEDEFSNIFLPYNNLVDWALSRHT